MLGQRIPECQLPSTVTTDRLWRAMGEQIYLNARSGQTRLVKSPTAWAILPGRDNHGVKKVLIDNGDPTTFSFVNCLRSAPSKFGRVFVRNTRDGVDETLRPSLSTPDLSYKFKVPHLFVGPQTPRPTDRRISIPGLDIFPVGDDTALQEVVRLRSQYAGVGTQRVRRTLAQDIQQSLANGEIRIMLAQKDGQSIATATATKYQGLIGIMNVLTAEGFRKQGVATALMQNLFNYYDKQNIAGYHLLASEGALNLYTGLGFQEADSACLYEWKRLNPFSRLDARVSSALEFISQLTS